MLNNLLMLKSSMKVMQLSLTLVIFIGVGTTGLISTLTVSHLVDAWHTMFQSREDCMYFFKTERLNTAGEADKICDKKIPHTYVTIGIDNEDTTVLLENK
jgi:hypothetical protein